MRFGLVWQIRLQLTAATPEAPILFSRFPTIQRSPSKGLKNHYSGCSLKEGLINYSITRKNSMLQDACKNIGRLQSGVALLHEKLPLNFINKSEVNTGGKLMLVQNHCECTYWCWGQSHGLQATMCRKFPLTYKFPINFLYWSKSPLPVFQISQKQKSTSFL